MALTEKLKAIADAIREKTGGSEEMTLDEMAEKIRGISGGDEVPEYLVKFMETREVTDEFKAVLEKMTSISDYAFYSCTSLSAVNCPIATIVGDSAFDACENLTTINLPVATSIGQAAFFNCTNLTTINLPAATSIGVAAFALCENLTTINLPAATSIGDEAFYECTNLTTINLPVATSIGGDAFVYCTNLAIIILRALTMCKMDIYISEYDDVNFNIYVPSDLVDTYKTDDVWANFGDRIKSIDELPEELQNGTEVS